MNTAVCWSSSAIFDRQAVLLVTHEQQIVLSPIEGAKRLTRSAIGQRLAMPLDTSNAVNHHSGGFPPAALDYGKLVPSLFAGTTALARYDQTLKSMHNGEILLAPLRDQEAVVSSRMEGTISTMDEILQLDAEFGEDDEEAIKEFRSEVIETLLYRRALNTAQHQLEIGWRLLESLVKSIHQQLLSFGRGASKAPGQYKREQN